MNIHPNFNDLRRAKDDPNLRFAIKIDNGPGVQFEMKYAKTYHGARRCGRRLEPCGREGSPRKALRGRRGATSEASRQAGEISRRRSRLYSLARRGRRKRVKTPAKTPQKKVEIFSCKLKALSLLFCPWLRFTSTSGTSREFSPARLLASTSHSRAWSRLNNGLRELKTILPLVCSGFTSELTHPKTKPGREPLNHERNHEKNTQRNTKRDQGALSDPRF